MNAKSYVWVPCSFAAIILAAVAAAQISAPDVRAQPTNQDWTVQPGQPVQPIQPVTPNQNRVRPEDRTTGVDRRTSEQKQSFKVSDMIGSKVYSEVDKEIGKIDDLMVQEDGKVIYAAVSFGGFLGMGDKLFAVPWEAVHLEKRRDPENSETIRLHAKINVTEQMLKDKRGFDKKSWPSKGDETLLPRRIGTAPLQNLPK